MQADSNIQQQQLWVQQTTSVTIRSRYRHQADCCSMQDLGRAQQRKLRVQRASSALLQQVDKEETKPAPSRLRRAATSPAVGPRSAVLARREHDVDQVPVSPQQRVSSGAAADVGWAMVPREQPRRLALAALRRRSTASRALLDVTCHLQLELIDPACQHCCMPMCLYVGVQAAAEAALSRMVAGLAAAADRPAVRAAQGRAAREVAMQNSGKRQDKSSAARTPQKVASCSPGAAHAGQQDRADSSRAQLAHEDKSDVTAPARSSRPAAPAVLPADAAPADPARAAKMQLQSADHAAKKWPQAAGSAAQEQPGGAAEAEAAGSSSAQAVSAAQTLPEAASVSSKAPGHTLERSSTTASSRPVQDAGRATLRRRQTEGELDLTLPGSLKASVCLWVCSSS